MEISISTRHGELNLSTQEMIQQKVSKLPRFFDRTTGIEVTVDLKVSTSPKVEVKVTAEETNDFFAADTGSNVLTAVESVIHKLETQLKKHKEKLTGHRGKSHRDVEAEME